MDDLDSQVVYLNHTRKQLYEAFLKVQNPSNWKMPINAIIPRSKNAVDDLGTLLEIKLAIEFFTASVPHIYGEDDKWRIVADGYYRCVGA